MQNPDVEPRNRLRAAFQVLMGRRVVPFQIQAEWVEYKVAFDDIFSKLSAALARQSKLHKSMIEQSVVEPEQAAPIEMEGRKADVRRRAATRALAVGRTGSRPMMHGPLALATDEGDDEP